VLKRFSAFKYFKLSVDCVKGVTVGKIGFYAKSCSQIKNFFFLKGFLFFYPPPFKKKNPPPPGLIAQAGDKECLYLSVLDPQGECLRRKFFKSADSGSFWWT